MRSFPPVFRGIAITLALGTVPAFAASPPEPAPVSPAVVAAVPGLPPPVEAAPAVDASGFGEPLATGALEDLRGGDGTTTNNVDLLGRVDGNTAQDIVSGTNVIQDGAFASASGISTVIQNSGSNVLIQNGMVVNVQFAGPQP